MHLVIARGLQAHGRAGDDAAVFHNQDGSRGHPRRFVHVQGVLSCAMSYLYAKRRPIRWQAGFI